MKKINRLLLSLVLTLTACSQALPSSTPTPATVTVTPTSGLPTPIVQTTKQPDVTAAVTAFLEAWKILDHAAMYSLITKEAQAGTTVEDFTKLYTDTENALTLLELNYIVGPSSVQQQAASAGVQVKVQIQPVRRIHPRPYDQPDRGRWRLEDQME